MAILQQLHGEDSTGKYEALEVQILPEGISEKDLWRIEAGLQLSRDKRLDYGPVNDLLKIREGLKSGLSAAEIAASLYGVKSAQEVTEKNQRLALIDNYLEYIGEPEEYTKGNRSVEHFINIQDLLRHLEKQSVKKTEQHKWLLIAFEMIRAGMGHMEIRNLRKIAGSDPAKAHLLKSIKPKEGARGAKEEKLTSDNTKDQFEIAKDYVQNEEDARKPDLLLSKAERAIETLLKHKADVIAKLELHAGVSSLATLLANLASDCERAKGKKKK